MTISEAQSVLHCPDAYGGIYGEKYGQALAVAFKSLEAWEKVKAEIEQTAKDYDKFDDYRRVCGLWIALKIIDKYRKGASEVDDG